MSPAAVVHLIEPVSPGLDIPRAHPCAALVDAFGMACGTAPAQLVRRVCLHGHSRDLYLCRPHEQAAGRMATCRDCADLRDGAHRCPVALVLLPEAMDLIRSLHS